MVRHLLCVAVWVDEVLWDLADCQNAARRLTLGCNAMAMEYLEDHQDVTTCLELLKKADVRHPTYNEFPVAELHPHCCVLLPHCMLLPHCCMLFPHCCLHPLIQP